MSPAHCPRLASSVLPTRAVPLIDGSVVFTGYLPEADKVPMMNLADVFVFPSLLEGFPLAPQEAMSCGKEIVTTEFGSASSMLGNAGLVVPIGKPDLLAAAMLKVADRRRDVNMEARDRAQVLFSISTIVSTWESIYLAFLRLCNHAST